MIRKVVITAFFATVAVLPALAQCNVKLYEDMKNVKNPFVFLKRYSMKVSRIEGVPFYTQYTYVFTRGNSYAFALAESDELHRLQFTLTNSDGEILNDQFVSVDNDDRQMRIYNAVKTGIYYLNVHTAQSFDGCAVLQLSYTNTKESAKVLNEADREFQSQFRSKKFRNLLKTFTIFSATATETSYVLTAGTAYSLRVETQSGANNLVTCYIVDAEGNDVPMQRRESDAGIFYSIMPSVTGVYHLKFDNADKRRIAMAALAWVAHNPQ
jgi:hypothetical protein